MHEDVWYRVCDYNHLLQFLCPDFPGRPVLVSLLPVSIPSVLNHYVFVMIVVQGVPVLPVKHRITLTLTPEVEKCEGTQCEICVCQSSNHQDNILQLGLRIYFSLKVDFVGNTYCVETKGRSLEQVCIQCVFYLYSWKLVYKEGMKSKSLFAFILKPE